MMMGRNRLAHFFCIHKDHFCKQSIKVDVDFDKKVDF